VWSATYSGDANNDGAMDQGCTNSGSGVTVQVGYSDGLRGVGFFPSPWDGSPNTVFVGSGAPFDAGAIRIINNGSSAITVNDVTVTLPGGQTFDLWGSNVVPAGGNLILTQTTQYNFDTSDFPTLSFPQTYPDGETAHAAHIDITVNGAALPTFLDTGHVLTTGGSDLAAGGANESLNWRLVGTTGVGNPGGCAAEQQIVSPAQPTLATHASDPITLGNESAPTITDSADLEGAYFPTGSITFTLSYAADGVHFSSVPAATQSDPVDHNGTPYYPASYTLPTSGAVAGTYKWSATYTSGDGNNLTASDDGTHETTVVSPAQPTLATHASDPITLGNESAPTITDSADLEGAYFPTGSITFTLSYAADGVHFSPVPAATQTDTVTHNGTPYYPASYTLPTTGTVAGTYKWSATYTSGDGNNLTASDDGTHETTVVNKANPTLATTASFQNTSTGGNVVNVAIINDSATLSGAYYPGSTLTFQLFGPGSSTAPVYSETDNVSHAVGGTFTITTHNTAVATQVGIYYWTVTYNGDGNNNGKTDTGNPNATPNDPNERLTVVALHNTGTARTIGFWHSSQALTYLNNTTSGYWGPSGHVYTYLNSFTGAWRNANGTVHTFTSVADLQSFINGASATNMANMLSAQTIATILNRQVGFINGSSYVYVGGISGNQYLNIGSPGLVNSNGFAQINALIAASVLELQTNNNANGTGTLYVLSNDPRRNYEEALKNVFDAINSDNQIFL
jgi:hypothetical protein